ncbi:MAG TPA: class I SAM-dependent methyltransferase, partial [Gemmatimonadaceae bacterium]|nr:class I SAM-dependent methyltransferase [Gemmatimonadaceae bacterium]
IGTLWIAHPTRALAMPAVVAALGAMISAAPRSASATRRAIAALTLAFALLVVLRPFWELSVSPYKGLPQVYAYPDARRVAERASPLGWVVAVRAPAFRHAPGLSLAYVGEFPSQTALFVDGELADAVTHWGAMGSDRAAMEILQWLPTALPYALDGRKRVLVLGAGSGTDVWMAVASGARRIVAVELNSALTMVSADLSPLPTRATTGADIQWIAGDARTVAARARERFDLITLAPGGGISGAAGGVHALNEDFLHTTDAYALYLRRLTEDGVLAISRWVTVPPRASVRVVLTAAEALRRVRPQAVANGLVVARSWGTTTVLIKPSGFSASDLGRLRSWAARRQLDLDWYPGATAPQARYNIPDEPTLTDAARAAVSHVDSARRFAAAYPFAVAPATDARPYPHRFLRARSLGGFLRGGLDRWLPFAEWGYIALLATLAQSAVLAALLILLPAIVVSLGRKSRGESIAPLVAYFSAIGLGYLAAEIAVIQQLTLLLGHPVYAVAAVLAAILVCSGVGSIWSDRLSLSHGRIAAITLVSSLALLAVVSLPLVHLLQPTSLLARAATAFVLVAPAATVMGTMFPLGLRLMARADTGRIAWAWSANGFSSVVSVPLSALIAVEWGSRVLLLVAAGAYLIAAVLTVADRGPRLALRAE